MKAWRQQAQEINAQWRKKHGEQAPPGLARRLAKLNVAQGKIGGVMSFLLYQLLAKGGWLGFSTSIPPVGGPTTPSDDGRTYHDPVAEAEARAAEEFPNQPVVIDLETHAPFSPIAF